MSSLATLYHLFADAGRADDGSLGGERAGRRSSQESPSIRSGRADEEVARLKAGDIGAFERLFKKHYLPLRRFARMLMASANDDGDVVEDVFAWIWESRERLDIHGSIESYLYGAVRHRALNLLRNQRKQIDLQARFVGEWERSRGSVGTGSTDADDLLTRVRAVIAELPERRRLVLTLRWEGGLSNTEIAETLGIAPQSVANLVQRALADVRAALPNEFR